MADYIPHDDKRREKNLKDFHGKTPKEIKNTRWYHGTVRDFGEFKQGRAQAIFLTKNPAFANEFASQGAIDHDWDDANKIFIPREGAQSKPNVMPVHVRAENPFDYQNKKHINALIEHLGPQLISDPFLMEMIPEIKRGGWDAIESGPVQKAIKKLGHDSFFVNETGEKNLAVYDPSQIKSATGNRGTFDPSTPDITKSEGGEVDDDGITAYHGSPHDFDKFDISKIGTGEGAQAFGHGLYFAEAEPVAQGYKKQLAQDFVHVDGKKIPHPSEENLETDHIYRLANHMYQMGHTADEAIEDAIRRAEKLKPNLNSEDFYKAKEAKKAQDWANQISYLKGKHIEWKKDPGHMYEVHIKAHPDDFLDWDYDLAHDNNAVVGDMLPGVRHYDRVMSKFKKAPTGQEFYHALAEIAGSDEAATRLLHQAGIKGVKYLDASSRKEGEGSRNYVVFDHDLVTTKRKYAYGGSVAA